MSHEKSDENIEQDFDEPVPIIITEEFFKKVQTRTQVVIKDLREHEQYQLANEFIRLQNVAENLQMNVKDEKDKFNELLAKQVEASGRIEESLRISERDRDVIRKLREEVIEAWKISDAAKAREFGVTEQMEVTLNKLNKTKKDLEKFTYKVDTEDETLGKHKTTVLQECERLTSEIDDLKSRLQVQRAYSDEIQMKIQDLTQKNQDLYLQWDDATNSSLANQKQVGLLKTKVFEMEENLDKVTETMVHYKSQTETLHARLKHRDQQLSEMRENLEKCRTENSILSVTKGKLELNLKNSIDELYEMRLEMGQLKNSSRLKEDENRKLILENERSLKRIERFIRNIDMVEQTASKLRLELQNQKSVIETAVKERDSIKKTNDKMQKESQSLQKKGELLLRENERRDGKFG